MVIVNPPEALRAVLSLPARPKAGSRIKARAEQRAMRRMRGEESTLPISSSELITTRMIGSGHIHVVLSPPVPPKRRVKPVWPESPQSAKCEPLPGIRRQWSRQFQRPKSNKRSETIHRSREDWLRRKCQVRQRHRIQRKDPKRVVFQAAPMPTDAPASFSDSLLPP